MCVVCAGKGISVVVYVDDESLSSVVPSTLFYSRWGSHEPYLKSDASSLELSLYPRKLQLSISKSSAVGT